MSNVKWNELWQNKEIKIRAKHLQALEILQFLLDKDNSIKSLYDFGCGQGLLLNEIKSLFPTLQLTGVDNNDFSKQQILNMGINYKNFDLIEDVNIAKIDVAILTDVLEHFYNPSQVINNLGNIKYLIIIVPNFSFITERISVLKGDVPFQFRLNRGGHIFYFNKITLEKLIEDSNYKKIFDYNLYPKKIKYLPFYKRFMNLFITSYGVLLEHK